MIIVQFLNGRIPMLARTGLNFADVRQCALGHLLAMIRGRPGERYLLGGTNLWLGEFLKQLEPFARHRAPSVHFPYWLSYATACVSETVAQFSSGWKPFVTRESVRLSRGPHFSSNEKAERELGYEAIPVEDAIRDAVRDFVARGIVPRPDVASSALPERLDVAVIDGRQQHPGERGCGDETDSEAEPAGRFFHRGDKAAGGG
jgi:nucleoside-diphosphate-sugar epimerase